MAARRWKLVGFIISCVSALGVGWLIATHPVAGAALVGGIVLVWVGITRN
jgi:hypothetical protein